MKDRHDVRRRNRCFGSRLATKLITPHDEIGHDWYGLLDACTPRDLLRPHDEYVVVLIPARGGSDEREVLLP